VERRETWDKPDRIDLNVEVVEDDDGLVFVVAMLFDRAALGRPVMDSSRT